jgi:hypothetical protein
MRGLKNRGENRLKMGAIFCLLFLIFVVLTNSVYKVYKKKVNAEETLVRMQQDITDLEKRQQELKSSLQRLETADGMAFEMRKKLNVAEVGESVAIIVDEEESKPADNVELSIWQKFKNFVVELFK